MSCDADALGESMRVDHGSDRAVDAPSHARLSPQGGVVRAEDRKQVGAAFTAAGGWVAPDAGARRRVAPGCVVTVTPAARGPRCSLLLIS